MKIKVLECSTCKSKFEKPMNEYKRRVKMGKTNFYCSLSCGKKTKSNIEMLNSVGKSTWFIGGENKLLTEEQKLYSSMKEFARRAKNRKNKFFEELDIEKMIEIWKYQNGKCRFTNVDLILPRDDRYKSTSNNYKASIDRIDSSKGYSIDNIQFVSYSINNLKNTMNENEVEEFFKIIKKHLSTKSMKID